MNADILADAAERARQYGHVIEIVIGEPVEVERVVAGVNVPAMAFFRLPADGRHTIAVLLDGTVDEFRAAARAVRLAIAQRVRVH